MIYVRTRGAKIYNERTVWYRQNISAIKKILNAAIILVLAFIVIIVVKNITTLFSLSVSQVLLIIAFPLIAASYTFSSKILPFRKIRQVGWIKPFIVGLTWSGWVTVYPIVLWQVQRGQAGNPAIFPSFLFWLQNFLFFSIIAIIFDLKDYRTDFRYNLKTYPVILGIRKTFYLIIIPATFLNIIVFFLFADQQNFSAIQKVIQFIPYVLLLCVLIFYRQHRSLLYYLVVVDGLVFVKAVCGISSLVFFKK
jgi:4-hydroxybenzoate polyprenyltransferase